MAQSVVTKALQENLVMVFSKSYCPHCLRAKRVLDAELGQSKYAVMELENRSDCAAIQDYLRQLTGARTVPRVFLQGIDRTVPPVLAALLARCRITCCFRQVHWGRCRDSTIAKERQIEAAAETDRSSMSSLDLSSLSVRVTRLTHTQSPADLVKGVHVMHTTLSLSSACSAFQTHLATSKQFMS